MEGEKTEFPNQSKTNIRPRGLTEDATGRSKAFPERDRRLPSGKSPFEAKEQPAQGHTTGTCPDRRAGDAKPDAGKASGISKRHQRGFFPSSYKPRAVFWVCAISAVLSGAVFFALGRQTGKSIAQAEASLAVSVKSQAASAAELAEFESALGDLENGMFPEAKNTLSKLLDAKANISSLALIAGNAALLDGDVAMAEHSAKLSIKRGESVSDALVLQAITEAKLATTPEHKAMGNPRIRIEALLEQAIAADASNPRPFFELATLRRFEKRHSEALEMLESASNRLGQSDSIMAVSLAKELVKLEELPDADLAGAVVPGKDAQSLLCAAYVAARLGDTPKAAELFSQARSLAPPKTFNQLLKDPAFVPWRKEPALEKFFPKTQTN